jgi:pyruvate dehydrogenase E2 component (dihydrolipoamide acetyltransferase)
VATEVILPRLGQGMEAGTIVRWLKSEGDRVERGEPLFELDTDKVTQEVEAEASGVLLRIAVAEGEVPVGQTVAFIGEAGESVPAAPVASAPRVSPTQSSTEAPAPEPAPAAVAPAPEGVPANGRVKASPLARRIARERGIDLRAVHGTGPDGRIVAEDVERAVAAPAPVVSPAVPAAPVAAGDVERRPLTNVRRTIARRLTQAWTVPAFTLTVSVDMTRANEVVAKQRELYPDVRVTVTDLLTRVCAQALMRHRDINVQFTEEELLVFPSADVGIAVAAPSGLVVPVVRAAERREGKLRAEDLDGGTFTISNLGMYDVDEFVAVLNPPQASILAVAATREQVVPMDGDLAVVPLMTATLTCDHRAVDGATGAEFLKTVKTFLEDPGLAL